MSTRRQWWLGGSPIAEVATASLVVDQKSHLWRMPQLKIKHLKQGEEKVTESQYSTAPQLIFLLIVDGDHHSHRRGPLAHADSPWIDDGNNKSLEFLSQPRPPAANIFQCTLKGACFMGVVTGQASWCHRCSSFFVVEKREKILCAAIFSLSQEVGQGRCSALDQSE